MSQVTKMIKPALICFAVMTLLCGAVYTGLVTAVAQAAFPVQAGGSIVAVKLSDGTTKEYGSELIGQKFTKLEYLIGRPAGVSNLSPTGEKQAEAIKERIDRWHSIDRGNRADIPADLITASGSGADPDISPEAAEYQVARIARARNISEDEVRNIITKCTTGQFLGFWGDPAVNVLKVNLMLDGLL